MVNFKERFYAHLACGVLRRGEVRREIVPGSTFLGAAHFLK